MPPPLINLLGKFVVLTGVGSSSILYFGVPNSTEKNRKYSLNLNLGTKELVSSFNKFEKEKESTDTWAGSRPSYQGVKTEEIKELFKQFTNSGKTIYKLVFNGEWVPTAKDNINNPRIKGALGLVKITWNNNYEGTVEEITIDDSNRVWLIVAKGAEHTYLIPSVRASGWLEEKKHCEKNIVPGSLAMSVLFNGIPNIKEWVGKNDGRKVWDSDKNEKLKSLMNKGFTILRGKDAVFGKAHEDLNKDSTSVYKNTGILIYKQAENIQDYKSCVEVEKYFPLDLVVIGEQSSIKGDFSPKWGDYIQRISVSDTIQDVMGVRLDQVIIDSEGISDGQEKKIKWNEKFKPTIAVEVKK